MFRLCDTSGGSPELQASGSNVSPERSSPEARRPKPGTPNRQPTTKHMALPLYLSFLGAACAFALVDWRRAWLLVIVAGVLQDPVRKLTPGTPVWVSFAVVALYAAVLFGARNAIMAEIRDFGRRFPNVYASLLVFFFLLLIATMNGVITFGVANWKVPAISLFTYCVPLVAAVLGYAWLQREEGMHHFFRVYAIVTSIALLGTIAEYLRVESRLLGMVALQGD